MVSIDLFHTYKEKRQKDGVRYFNQDIIALHMLATGNDCQQLKFGVQAMLMN